MPYILPTLLLGTLFTSSFPALFYYGTASWKLLAYESTTKKAAKVSAEAGHQLRKTRTTQGAALVASLVSVGSASALLYDLFSNNQPSMNRVYWHVTCAFASILVGGAADFYVSGFWQGAMKALLPGMRGYNDAVRATENGLWWSRNLLYGWGTYALYALTFQVQNE